MGRFKRNFYQRKGRTSTLQVGPRIWDYGKQIQQAIKAELAWAQVQRSYRSATLRPASSSPATIFSLYRQIRVWSKPDAINSTDFALNAAKHALEYYEEFFNISYPLPKMGKDRTFTWALRHSLLNPANMPFLQQYRFQFNYFKIYFPYQLVP